MLDRGGPTRCSRPVPRAPEGHLGPVIRTGQLIVDLKVRTVEFGGRRVQLTRKEYQVLELLSIEMGSALTREMFMDHLYDNTDKPRPKIIDVFICKLRKKLAPAAGDSQYIETVWGRGYALTSRTGDEPAQTPYGAICGQSRVNGCDRS